MLKLVAHWLGRTSTRMPAQTAAPGGQSKPEAARHLDIRQIHDGALGVLGAPAPCVQAFTLPQAAPGVIAQDAKLACDLACDANFRWALGGLFAEGLGFLGYPYLAELSQRPEYPRPAEVLAKEITCARSRRTPTSS
ncbi:hypothetical protein AWB70_04696 [Caballeronia cordobensis]|uniref:Uncharacterized protein n=1 Tax=Caballeronia cordobensis TaxID=1353886 RepID=A0A158IEP5_CABCO|nr:hypothetical protein [Caballeronia cordobensis]SAL55058.1 hypothetical protein AWB70_04696 [Caballeronia cordobensis]